MKFAFFSAYFAFLFCSIFLPILLFSVPILLFIVRNFLVEISIKNV